MIDSMKHIPEEIPKLPIFGIILSSLTHSNLFTIYFSSDFSPTHYYRNKLYQTGQNDF